MAISDDSIKLLVREEVARQMAEVATHTFAPMQQQLNAVDKRVRSFYSNGSGGPPGALEIWREEDKRMREEDRQDFAELKEQVCLLASESSEASQFIRDHKLEKEEYRRRHQRRVQFIKWALPIVLSVFGTVIGILWHAVAPVASYMWEEYVRAHPALQMKLENRSQNISDEMLSREDAGGPPDLHVHY